MRHKLWHKPIKGWMSYEWQFGWIVFQFCYNDNWDWRRYATFWRINIWNSKPRRTTGLNTRRKG